jgi:hypothetical protein
MCFHVRRRLKSLEGGIQGKCRRCQSGGQPHAPLPQSTGSDHSEHQHAALQRSNAARAELTSGLCPLLPASSQICGSGCQNTTQCSTLRRFLRPNASTSGRKFASAARRGQWIRTRIASTAEGTHRHDLVRSRRTAIHFTRFLRAELKPVARLPRAPSFCNRLHINCLLSHGPAHTAGGAGLPGPAGQRGRGPGFMGEHGAQSGLVGKISFPGEYTALALNTLCDCHSVPTQSLRTTTCSPTSSGPLEMAVSMFVDFFLLPVDPRDASTRVS